MKDNKFNERKKNILDLIHGGPPEPITRSLVLLSEVIHDTGKHSKRLVFSSCTGLGVY